MRAIVGGDREEEPRRPRRPEPAVQRGLDVLALQRTAGNALVSRYFLRVEREQNRKVPYHQADSEGSYDPRGAPNLRHVDGPPAGDDAVYVDDEKGTIDYPQAHGEEHKTLVAIADDVIDLLLRRADRGLSAEDRMYMIGVMADVELVRQQTDEIKSIVVTRSAKQPASFKETLKSFATLHKELKVRDTGDLPTYAELKPDAPDLEPITVKDSKSGQTRQNLKDCAAKKLVLTAPAERRFMTEVLYDPEGEHPVRVENDKRQSVRYHHRQRVPSCADCQKNLVHLHDAMQRRLDVVGKAATSITTGPPSEKPLKVESKPLVGSTEVKPGDKQQLGWAEEALSLAPPKQLGTPLGEAIDSLKQAMQALDQRIGALRSKLLDHYWYETIKHTQTRPKDVPREVATAAWARLVKPHQDLDEHLRKTLQKLENEHKNPYLHKDVPRVGTLVQSARDAIGHAKDGPQAREIAALEDEMSAWRKGRDHVPEPTEPPAPAQPLEQVLAADGGWQKSLALLAEHKLTVPRGLEVQVDSEGRATIADLETVLDRRKVRKDQIPLMANVIREVLPRLPFRANQPGKYNVTLSK